MPYTNMTFRTINYNKIIFEKALTKALTVMKSFYKKLFKVFPKTAEKRKCVSNEQITFLVFSDLQNFQ